MNPPPSGERSRLHPFHFTPKHGSWLNQVELWFGVLVRRFLARGNFPSVEDFEKRGRACFSPRPKTYERLLYPPRPYTRNAA